MEVEGCARWGEEEGEGEGAGSQNSGHDTFHSSPRVVESS